MFDIHNMMGLEGMSQSQGNHFMNGIAAFIKQSPAGQMARSTTQRHCKKALAVLKEMSTDGRCVSSLIIRDPGRRTCLFIYSEFIEYL